jgi:hypothetical protein
MDELIKDWFEWCRENRDENTPTLTALYTWVLYKSSSLDYVEKFGLPSSEAMHHIGISSYNTYIKHLQLLDKYEFIKIVKRAKNQYSSNVIALSNFDKASVKQIQSTSIADTKQIQSTSIAPYKASEYNSSSSNSNNSILYRSFDHLQLTNDDFNKLVKEGFPKDEIDDILDEIEAYPKNKNYKSLVAVARKWMKKNRKQNTSSNNAGVKKSNVPVDFKTREHVEHDKRERAKTNNTKPAFVYGSQMKKQQQGNN